MGLQIFGVVTAGKGNAEHTLRGLADLKSLHNASGRFYRRHNQRVALRDAVLFLTLFHYRFHPLYIQGALRFWDTDCIAAAGYSAVDVLFPVRGIQAIDADYPFTASVVNLL